MELILHLSAKHQNIKFMDSSTHIIFTFSILSLCETLVVHSHMNSIAHKGCPWNLNIKALFSMLKKSENENKVLAP